jgi:hypothetical protein
LDIYGVVPSDSNTILVEYYLVCVTILLLNVVFGVNIIFIKLDYSRSGII